MTSFFTTGNASSFKRIAEDWLNYKVEVANVSIKELEAL